MPIVGGAVIPEAKPAPPAPPDGLVPALLSGILLALTLPAPGLSPLAWLALVPLMLACDEASVLKAAAYGWAAGFAYHAFAFNWIVSAANLAGMGALVGLIGWLGLALLQGAAWGAAAALGARAARGAPGAAKPLAWALAWTACAAALDRWTARVPFDLLAYSQWRFLPLIQVGAVAGPHALGFLIVLCNAGAAEAWRERGTPRRAGAATLLLALAAVAAAAFYGSAVLAGRKTGGPSKRVEILQAAVDPHRKWDPAFQEQTLEIYKSLMWKERTAMPDLVVWPETALPGMVPENTVPFIVKLGASRSAAPQVAGMLTGAQGRRLLNSALAVGRDGSIKGVYHKRRLVPLGEMIPFEERLRPHLGVLWRFGGFLAGPAVQPLLDTPLGPTGVAICFEVVFPALVRSDAARGARLLLNLSNDAWYGGTWGPDQHSITVPFRAVENRMTVVRAANNGISAVYDPWGMPLAKMGFNERGRLDVDVPVADPFPGRSLYARLGDWFGLACMAGLVVLLALSLRRRPPPSAALK